MRRFGISRHARAAAAVVVAASVAVITLSEGVLASNAAPTSYDQAFATNGESIEVTLHARDTDGDGLAYAVVDEPRKGTLSGRAPSFLYTPSSAFDGADSFTWRASDETSASSVATVSLVSAPTSGPEATGPASTAQTTASAISFKSSSTAASGEAFVTSLAVQRPIQVGTGDLMWMQVATVRPQINDKTGVMDPIVPSGWVLIRKLDVGSTVRSYLYRKIAGSEFGAYTVDFGVPSQAAIGIGVWSGANPFRFAVSEATAVSATSLSVPGVWGVAGGRVAGFFATLGGSVTVPDQMSSRWHASAGPILVARSVSAGADEPVAGPIGSRTARSSSPSTWIGHLISMWPK